MLADPDAGCFSWARFEGLAVLAGARLQF